MDIALVFAPTVTPGLEPYGSAPFLAALRDAGLTPHVISADDGLAASIARVKPRIVQTFGDVAAFGSAWALAERAALPVLHVVESGARTTPARRLPFSGPPARGASRSVGGVIGSSRADLGRMLDDGYFSRAAFSMIATPPVVLPPIVERRAAASGVTPTFGHCDPSLGDRRSLDALLRAIELTGQPEHLTVRIARDDDRRVRRKSGATHLSFVSPGRLDDFIAGIDVLLVTEAADRLVPSVAMALASGCVVVAPDAGVMAELLDYGRRGVLYTEGSSYHLARAINEVAASWQNRPFDFAAVEASLARVSPQAAAATFREACRRLAS